MIMYMGAITGASAAMGYWEDQGENVAASSGDDDDGGGGDVR